MGDLQTVMKINSEECTCCSGTGIIPGRMLVDYIVPIKLSFMDGDSTVPGTIERKEYDHRICPHCRGVGKTDWVRKVTKSDPIDNPDMTQVTEEVRQLVDEDNVFGAEVIKIETKRKAILKEIEEDESQRKTQ